MQCHITECHDFKKIIKLSVILLLTVLIVAEFVISANIILYKESI